MAVGQTYRLSVVGSALDQTIVNTFHFLQTGTPGGGALACRRHSFQVDGRPDRLAQPDLRRHAAIILLGEGTGGSQHRRPTR